MNATAVALTFKYYSALTKIPENLVAYLCSKVTNASGSMMRNALTNSIYPDADASRDSALIAFNGRHPIAWAKYRCISPNASLQIFVKEEYRKQGIATDLSRMLLQKENYPAEGSVLVFSNDMINVVKSAGYFNVVHAYLLEKCVHDPHMDI